MIELSADRVFMTLRPGSERCRRSAKARFCRPFEHETAPVFHEFCLSSGRRPSYRVQITANGYAQVLRSGEVTAGRRASDCRRECWPTRMGANGHCIRLSYGEGGRLNMAPPIGRVSFSFVNWTRPLFSLWLREVSPGRGRGCSCRVAL